MRLSLGGQRRGKADLHVHSLYSDGTATLQELLDWVEHETDLDLLAITDHERIDGALRARELHARGDYHFELAIGEEVTTRRGHVLALFVEERIPALRPLAETLERIHAAGGVAIAAHPMAPLGLSSAVLRGLHREAEPARRLDGIELFNPSMAGRVARVARHRLNTELLQLPAVGFSDAHIVESVGTGWTWFPGTGVEDFRRALAGGQTEPGGVHWSTWHNVAVYRRQLVAKARHLAHTLRPSGEWR
jgi:predicted metal-dependent phosphoesterase TrpH